MLLGQDLELARDILQDLHAVLRRFEAELFYRHEQRAMLLMAADRSKAVGGRYKVVGLLKRIAQVGTKYDKGIFEADPVLQPNMIRPIDHAQVEDIIKSMLEVLAKHCATLTFDAQRRGMILAHGSAEIALVFNITRFGAAIERGVFEFATEAATIDEGDIAKVKRLLGGGR